MLYRILGPLEVVDGDRTVALGGGKQRALLALLVIRAGELVSVDALADGLWGDEPPDSAENVVQVYVSKLRKAIESATGRADVLVTRKPGYVLQLAREDDVDARAFERAVDLARAAAARGDHAEAARSLREADALWRGGALADFAFEPFAQAEIARLEELRLDALEERLHADLALGRGRELVAELESLVARHPLREGMRSGLMVALYRAGRQADALSQYQDARRALTDELGIDPSPALQDLERRILEQDPTLDARAPAVHASDAPVPPELSILVAPRAHERLAALLAVAEPLSRATPPRELILTRLLGPWEGTGDADVGAASAALRAQADELERRGAPARIAAFTSSDAAGDLERLAGEHAVDLVVFDAAPEELADAASSSLTAVLERVACDVAIVLGAERERAPGAPILVPFGGADHDWAALQLAAWLARAMGAPLRLAGTTADEAAGMRDASRLLGSASLVVQRLTRVVAEPVLVEPGRGVIGMARDAGLVVAGLSERWRTEGLGETRAAIAREARAPVLVLRRGERSTALAARADQTRYAWSRVARADDTDATSRS